MDIQIKEEKSKTSISMPSLITWKIYMAFILGNHLTFIDSFQFMSSSLYKLVSNLPKDDLIYTSKASKAKD